MILLSSRKKLTFGASHVLDGKVGLGSGLGLDLSSQWGDGWSGTNRITNGEHLRFRDYVHSAEIWCTFGYMCGDVCVLESSERKFTILRS